MWKALCKGNIDREAHSGREKKGGEKMQRQDTQSPTRVQSKWLDGVDGGFEGMEGGWMAERADEQERQRREGTREADVRRPE